MDTNHHNMFDEIARVNNVYNTLIVWRPPEAPHENAQRHDNFLVTCEKIG
jgi:hypothetical protein